METLGEYLEEMRQRHPRLSMRRMALEANVGESIIRGIVKEGRGALPHTLKALADKWGTDEDYIRMLQLAGHPIPKHTLIPQPARHLGDLEWDEVETALGYLCTYGGISMSDQSYTPEGWPAPYNLRRTLREEWERAKERCALQRQKWESFEREESDG